MSLIPEDGTGLANAETYAIVAELRSYSAKRLLTIPADDEACEVILIKAMDFLESLKYKGVKLNLTQALSWPRKEFYLDCTLQTSSVIPKKLKDAQCNLAVISQTIDLMPNAAVGSKGAVMSESVYGAVSRTYALPGRGTGSVPTMPSVKSLLQDFVTGGFGPYSPIFSIRA